MKKMLAPVLASALALTASTAFAGGPVVIEEEVVPAATTSSVGILPIIIVGIALCAALCGNDDDSQQP